MLRRFFQLLIIFIMSIFIGNVAYGMYEEFKISYFSEDNIELKGMEKNVVLQNIANENYLNNISDNTKEIVNIPDKYMGYSVDAKLEIPKIGLDTYVFKEYNEESMWICPTKYFGPEPNDVGNYCIAAHNYNKKNMFNKIIKLKKQDVLYLSDNDNGRQKYIVNMVYKVKPNNTKPLNQDTMGNKEITLITCSDYSSLRIIVKAVLVQK